MSMDRKHTAVGIFADRAQAIQAIQRLRAAGFIEDQVGLLTHDRQQPFDDIEHEGPSTTSGAVGGGLIGGVLGILTSLLVPGVGPLIAAGALVLTLGGVVLGAAAGGLAAGLMRLGISEEEAERYQSEIVSGSSLVTVTGADRYDEAVSLLKQSGATNIDTSTDNTTVSRDESVSPILFPTAVGDPMSGTVGSVNGPLAPVSDPVVSYDELDVSPEIPTNAEEHRLATDA